MRERWRRWFVVQAREADCGERYSALHSTRLTLGVTKHKASRLSQQMQKQIPRHVVV